MKANRSCKALNLSVDTIQSASLRIYRELDRAGKHVIAQTVSDRYLEQNVPNAIPYLKHSKHTIKNQYDNYISAGFKGLRRKNQVLQNDK